MKTEFHWSLFHRVLLALALAPCLIGFAPAIAADALEVQQAGRLRIAVYRDFAPWSTQGKGIDIALGQALAKQLGLEAEIVEFGADDDMSDDLRNMVWKGHYLGTRPGDVMLHVPVDPVFAQRNDKVAIFAPYYLETLAVVRDPARIPPVEGSAAKALEVFTRERVGVETRSLADGFLLGVLAGRLRENVIHFPNTAAAIEALRKGEVAAVMGSRSEVEAGLGEPGRYVISAVKMPELRAASWPLGLAVKAESTALAAALAQAMTQLLDNGTIATIFRTYGVAPNRAAPN